MRRRTHMITRFLALVVLVVSLCACGAEPDSRSTTTIDNVTTTAGSPSTTGGDVTDQLADTAAADLAQRLRVDVGDIEVLRVEEITWPDGSLGCPEPGKMYTQALVEGHRIVLGHDERVFLYHSGGDVEPFLCPSDEKDGGYDFVPPPGGDVEK